MSFKLPLHYSISGAHYQIEHAALHQTGNAFILHSQLNKMLNRKTERGKEKKNTSLLTLPTYAISGKIRRYESKPNTVCIIYRIRGTEQTE